MRVKSDSYPERVTIESDGRQATVILADDVVEAQSEDGVSYDYEMVKLTANYRDNLEESVVNNFEKWYEMAKKEEQDKLAAEIRATRDELLAATDYAVLPDSVIDEDGKKEIIEYRQALRDITDQDGFPESVIYPDIPTGLKTKTIDADYAANSKGYIDKRIAELSNVIIS